MANGNSIAAPVGSTGNPDLMTLLQALAMAASRPPTGGVGVANNMTGHFAQTPAGQQRAASGAAANRSTQAAAQSTGQGPINWSDPNTQKMLAAFAIANAAHPNPTADTGGSQHLNDFLQMLGASASGAQGGPS